MFTEFDLDNNIEDIYVHSLNRLCSDSMFILQNNSKVLRFLTDETLSKELDMLVSSAFMAIKHERFELLQNIILGLKNEVHKLAAFEIKYFDEYEVLLRTDIYNKFMTKNFKKHAFVVPSLKEVFEVLDQTITLSPTNAAFALKTALETGETDLFDVILHGSELTDEFVRQIEKRFHANFGMTLDEEIENSSYKNSKKDVIKNFFAKAI